MTHKDVPTQDDHDRGVRNEERLCANDERWEAHTEAQRQEWVAHNTVHELEAQALRLQHTEYERRLEDLNHEAARISGRDALYATRELVEGNNKGLLEKYETYAGTTDRRLGALERSTITVQAHEQVLSRLTSLENFRNRAMGAAVIIVLISGAIGAAIAKALGG